ncbi:RagB/SusD family nutrient uptake outer membrane protein [Sinomicrobium soli]|uniref:RagB/SusD family nutrient uptake outer membrane protein n=1 Tax=Sinomicrobium sp. N-1-3-6 TaxID=2219864 RepID=UPI000DCB5E14|nr:RagB/SusD family nutrient uptake outer membrane protein [Sinomicrobium sp. N-1-3-6]RAV27611.1 hypothetical protein DN748_17635 [Sinomicrobium sp. N-1-3-6]
MNIYKKHLLWICGVALLTSCDSFLDEVPDNRTELDSAEKIGELLAGAYPESSYFMIAESMSDNATDIGSSGTSNIDLNTTMYYWEDTFEDGRDTPTHYWNACYSAIAQANQALQAIEELEGGEALDGKKGEALLCRAYAHFMLVTLFGKAYDPETSGSDIGVPIITEPEKTVLVEYERATVAEVYEQVEKDLTAGLELVTDDYEQPKFHFTRHAAYAFASRFYLVKGEWEKVIDYTTRTLEGNPAKNIRDWNYYRTLTFDETKLRHQSSEEPTNLLIVGASSYYARQWASGRYGASIDVRNELFSNSHPLSKSWAYSIFVYSSVRYFIPKYEEYFKYTNISSGIGYPYAMNVLFTYDEVLLNRIEANIMLNNFEPAVQDINVYLSKKTREYDPENDMLTLDELVGFYQPKVSQDQFSPHYTIAQNQLPLIKCVLDCRQREFLHEGIRWIDNKRLGMEIIHLDYDGNEYTLSKDDNRRQLQIPEIAQALGMEANPR